MNGHGTMSAYQYMLKVIRCFKQVSSHCFFLKLQESIAKSFLIPFFLFQRFAICECRGGSCDCVQRKGINWCKLFLHCFTGCIVSHLVGFAWVGWCCGVGIMWHNYVDVWPIFDSHVTTPLPHFPSLLNTGYNSCRILAKQWYSPEPLPTSRTPTLNPHPHFGRSQNGENFRHCAREVTNKMFSPSFLSILSGFWCLGSHMKSVQGSCKLSILGFIFKDKLITDFWQFRLGVQPIYLASGLPHKLPPLPRGFGKETTRVIWRRRHR